MMKQDIFQLLDSFRSQFSYKTTFIWFIVVIFGFLLRFDHYGVSSFVRWLCLPPTSYPLLLNFFHSSAWDSGELMMQWITLSREKFPLVSFNERLVVLGDGIKVSKESRCQPGLKFLHSPSQNQSKPQRFIGHHFGCMAFVAENNNEYRAILQAAQMHEGVDYLDQKKNNDIKKQPRKTVVSRMMNMLIIVAKAKSQPMYAVLDALFSTAVAFNLVFNNRNRQEDGHPRVHLITRAKNNYVAYTDIKRYKKNRVKLSTVFDNPDLFSEHPHPLHPKRRVTIYHQDLYWGIDCFFLRFVWVVDGSKKFVLMSSDKLLDPLSILKCYGLRFQIEFSFRALKHIIGGFNYRFWSSLCRLNKSKQALVSVDKDREKAIVEKSALKLNVIERFVNLAIIALGILSYLAFTKSNWVWDIHQASSWLRSYSSKIPSDETVQRALQSYWISSFSLGMVQSWVKSGAQLNLPGRRGKVSNHHTLGHFLSG